MITLKSYQKEAVQAIEQHFLTGSRQFCEMPTGSGKTITFLSYAQKNHKKILIIVTTKDLMNQVYESALLFFHKTQISRKGDHYNEKISTVHICIVHSIRGEYLQNLRSENFDLVIIDEAHHSQSMTYTRFIDGLKPGIKILGMTATPERMDGKLLENLLHHKSVSLSLDYMISNGHLCDIDGYSVKTNIDLSSIDDHNGDFSLNLLYKKLSNTSRNNLIVSIVKNDLKDRKCMVFCINIKHSQEISALLNQNGISSHHIDGAKSPQEREKILSAFREGSVSCITNCQLLTEGFDEPSVDGIVLARPTRSKSLFKQMIGRGLRLYPGKKYCKVIDVVDSHRSLAGFNSLYAEQEEFHREIERVESFQELKNYIQTKRLELSEFKLEKSSLFLTNGYQDNEATYSMEKYLQDNQIYYDVNISFDEASFLIWKNEFKKRIMK